MTHRTLVVDISNVLFRVAKAMQARDKSLGGAATAGLSMHSSLVTINKWYNKFTPDRVIFAFEGGNNWRKAWTASDLSVRKVPYKGNRVKDPEMEPFFAILADLKELTQKHSAITCLSLELMEADDVIAAYCQTHANENNEVYVLSGDRDFIQLLRNPHVKLVDPDTGKFRNQPGDDNYEPDLDYWIFLKCIRGDTGDFVFSAYPRVREDKIRKAFEDKEYELVNFMNITWEDKATGKQWRVGDLYEENKILLDLTAHPKELREYLEAGLSEQLQQKGTYSYFNFIRFLSKYELKKISSNFTTFAELFSRGGGKVKHDIPVIEDESQIKTLEEHKQVIRDDLFGY